MIVYARRASAILYNLLRTRGDARPYLMPANVCPIVPETFAAAGQAFEIVDVAEPWLELDTGACAARLRESAGGYAGVLFVHPYGSTREATPFFEELRALQPDLFLIDDKCLCRPDCDGAALSPLADATLFSTGRAKYADLGGGGFAHVAAEYREFGGTVREWLDLHPPEVPWDEYRRRTEAESAEADAQKQALNAIYAELLPRAIQLPPELHRWRFNIRVRESERLVAAIFEAGLFASRHYPSLRGAEFPVAHGVQRGIVNLFNDRYFDERRARLAAEIVVRHVDATAAR
ncbi:MAG TPA: hypothetical protein VF883_10290 [Thermoanaerobaculia bacterium]|jgi:hypothetical protein